MLTVTIITESRQPEAGPGRGSAQSILSLPLGTGTVLSRLCEQVTRIGSRDVWIVSDSSSGLSEIDLESVESKTGVSIRLMGRYEVPRSLLSLEPSDMLLFIEPSHWPACGHNLTAIRKEVTGLPGAIHSVAVGADRTDACERVLFDHAGRVHRIRRLYAGVTQTLRLRGVVTHSILPVAAMEGIEFTSVSDLPSRLAAAGVVARDFAVETDIFDLRLPREYLGVCEAETSRLIAGPVPADYSRLQPGVIVGRGAIVDPSATLHGPVIIQGGCMIENNVTIIGPAVIGAGARLAPGVHVVQAVVCQQAQLATGSTARHCIVVNELRHDGHDQDSQHFNACGWTADEIERANADEWSGDGRMFAGNAMQTPESDFDDMPTDAVAPELSETATIGPVAHACKRAVDILLTLVALLLALPVMLVAAVLVKLDSRGPLMFIHYREGRFGHPFPCLKFRTMTADAHELQRKLASQNMLDGPHFKITNDPRVTRIGRVLRKYNIDELPQLFNVLAGHMSLVGPRPSPFRENQYCVPWRRARLSVRPGVTGIWQICRSGRHEGDFQQWIYYDMIYVRRMTPWLDLKILAATAYALLTSNEVPVSWLVASQHAARQRPIDTYQNDSVFDPDERPASLEPAEALHSAGV
ncbi:MAG: sugar transferase [Phycisphaerae bacterium]|nr:sugar transferase [Phycisphaerae bacterium]